MMVVCRLSFDVVECCLMRVGHCVLFVKRCY